MLDMLKKIKWMSLIIALIYIIFGIVLLLYPGQIADMMCDLFGIGLIIYGIINIVMYFLVDIRISLFRNDFAAGVIMILIGVMVIYYKEMFQEMMPFLLAIAIITSGVYKLQDGIDAARIGYSQGWLYIIMAVSFVVLIAFNIRDLYGSWEETIRHSAFQVSALITTTGYGTTNIDAWPAFSKALVLLLMVTGACAGSTAGGYKLARVLLAFKSLGRNIRKVLQPRKVQVVRINGKVIDEQVLDNANAYLAAYVIIIILVFVVISLDGYSVEANLSATLSCFNNIGPAFGEMSSNFSGYSDLSKLVLTAAMLTGRLEIFPILILCSGSTWRRK